MNRWLYRLGKISFHAAEPVLGALSAASLTLDRGDGLESRKEAAVPVPPGALIEDPFDFSDKSALIFGGIGAVIGGLLGGGAAGWSTATVGAVLGTAGGVLLGAAGGFIVGAVVGLAVGLVGACLALG